MKSGEGGSCSPLTLLLSPADLVIGGGEPLLSATAGGFREQLCEDPGLAGTAVLAGRFSFQPLISPSPVSPWLGAGTGRRHLHAPTTVLI